MAQKKMKILYGAQPAIAIKKGGLYTQVLKTKSQMEQLGFEIDFYDPWKEPGNAEYRLFHLFGANFSTNILGTLIKEKDIPLIVTPVFFSRHKAPMLRCVNEMNRVLFKGFKVSTPHIYMKELLDRADKVLPNTDMERRLLVEGFRIPESKVTLIHNGVDEGFFSASPELFIEKYGLKDFILYVGYIGNERKNTLNFIRALKTIDAKVVLIGPVNRTRYGERCLEEIKRNKNIKVLQPLPHNSPLLASAYAACDTFILPSLFETPGLAALEAGLAGAKIVITKYGGTTEYFGENAVYIEPRSVGSIRNGIKRSLAQEKNELLKNRIRKHFLWKDIAQNLARVYKSFPPMGDGQWGTVLDFVTL